MNKKNADILTIVSLVLITLAPSFYLLSTAPGKRRPGEPSNRIRQTSSSAKATADTSADKPARPMLTQSAPTQVMQPISAQQYVSAPQLTNQVTQETEEAPAPAAQKELPTPLPAKNLQIATPPASGWLAWTYATIVPVILITLDKAVGGGIAASTKTAIKLAGVRNQFKNAQIEAQQEAKQMVEAGGFEKILLAQANKKIEKNKILEDSPEYANLMQDLKEQMTLPKQEKVNQLTKSLLLQQKIDPDVLEKTTSTSSILSQAISAGILNTIIPMIGTFIGYGITLSLQSLMPAQNQ